MLFHLCIRNDDHCPTCRQPTVTFFETKEEAVEHAIKLFNHLWKEEEIAEYRERLSNGESIWIDEWVRRSNGDRIQIVKVSSNDRYKLTKKKLYGNYAGVCGANYLLLQAKVNPEESCPDNITYQISLHSTLDETYKMFPLIIGDIIKSGFPYDKNYYREIKYQLEYTKLDTELYTEYSELLTKYQTAHSYLRERMDKLQDDGTVIIYECITSLKDPESSKESYFEIINLNKGAAIDLNFRCMNFLGEFDWC